MPYADPEKRRANWFKNHEQRLARQREYYRKHRAKRLAAKKATYDPDKQHKKNQRDYYANQQARVEYAREYRRKNREKVATKAREKYRANSDKIEARRKVLRQRPEARAKAYANTRKWLEDHPDAAERQHAKRVLAEQVGCRVRDIPNDLAEAKAEQLKIARWVRGQVAASGIETGTAKSEALSAKHESPTANEESGDAQ